MPDRRVERQRVFHHRLQLGLGARRHERDVRQRAQIGDVVEAHVRRAVVAHETGPVHAEHDREVLHHDVVDDLVVRALQERRVDRADRAQSARRQPGGEAHGVRLGDADVEVALGKAFTELGEAGTVGHRGGDADDPRIPFGERDHGVAEDVLELRTGARAALLRAVARLERVGADAVERARVALGRLVALALDRADVQQHGAIDVLRRLQRVHQRRRSCARRSVRCSGSPAPRRSRPSSRPAR